MTISQFCADSFDCCPAGTPSAAAAGAGVLGAVLLDVSPRLVGRCQQVGNVGMEGMTGRYSLIGICDISELLLPGVAARGGGSG